MNTISYIYTLSHPITDDVVYVGRTKNPKLRLNNHLNGSDKVAVKNKWVQGLRETGLLPKMDIVDSVSAADGGFWEQHYIFLFRSWGFVLLNHQIKWIGNGFHEHNEKTKHLFSIKRKGISTLKSAITHKQNGLYDRHRERMLGESNPGKLNKKSVIKMTLNVEDIEEYSSIKEAALKNNLTATVICAICRGHISKKTHGGFRWKYKQ